MAPRARPFVSRDDRSGDVLIFSDPVRRRSGSSWVSGPGLLRGFSADEAKDFWSPVLGDEAETLKAEAEAALGAGTPAAS